MSGNTKDLNWIDVYDSEEFDKGCGGLRTDLKNPTGKATNVKGSIHVHAGLEPMIPNVACKIRTTHDLSKRSPMAYVKLVDKALKRGTITQAQYDSMCDPKNANDRAWTETSPIIVLPGDRDGMMLKIKMGKNGPEGGIPSLTIHEVILFDLIDRQYQAVCDFLDTNPDIKRTIVENSFPNAEFEKSIPLIDKPARGLVVHPLKEDRWEKDTTLATGVVARRGTVKTHVARTWTLKPMIKAITKNAKGEKETLVRTGEFAYNSSNGDDANDQNTNSVWGMTTQVPFTDAYGKRSMVFAKCIKDVRPFMYVKPENREKDTRIKVPKHPHFYMKAIPDRIGLPMLQCSKGEINLQYYVNALSIFGKVESGGSTETENQRLIHCDILNEIEAKEGVTTSDVGSISVSSEGILHEVGSMIQDYADHGDLETPTSSPPHGSSPSRGSNGRLKPHETGLPPSGQSYKTIPTAFYKKPQQNYTDQAHHFGDNEGDETMASLDQSENLGQETGSIFDSQFDYPEENLTKTGTKRFLPEDMRPKHEQKAKRLHTGP